MIRWPGNRLLSQIKIDNMKNVDEIIEKMAGELSSLNYDFLTDKELNRADKFLTDLRKKSEYLDKNKIYVEHPEWAIKRCAELINGLKSYLESLRIKIKKREGIPNWYIQNKL